LPRRQCRLGGTGTCGAAGNRADGSPSCAHALARRGSNGSVRGRKKLRESAAKLLKSFARVNLCAGGNAALPVRPEPSNPSILRGFDSAGGAGGPPLVGG